MPSEKIVFLDTEVFKGRRFITEKVLDVQSETHFKPTETFQYTHFSSCHPLSVKKGFEKGEALCLLRTNSVKGSFELRKKQFLTRVLESFELRKKQLLTRLLERGYPKRSTKDIVTDINFSMGNASLQKKLKTSKKIIPFITTFNPASPNLKKIIIKHWRLIAGNNNLARIFLNSPMVSYRN